MKGTKEMCNNETLSAASICVEFDRSTRGVTVYGGQDRRRLLLAPGLDILSPVIDGESVVLTLSELICDGSQAVLSFSGSGVTEFKLTLEAAADRIDVSCSFRAPDRS